MKLKLNCTGFLRGGSLCEVLVHDTKYISHWDQWVSFAVVAKKGLWECEKHQAWPHHCKLLLNCRSWLAITLVITLSFGVIECALWESLSQKSVLCPCLYGQRPVSSTQIISGGTRQTATPLKVHLRYLLCRKELMNMTTQNQLNHKRNDHLSSTGESIR
jgi:hypothetical protein